MRSNNAFQNLLMAKVAKFNWHLLFFVFITCIYGLIALYSAGGGSFHPWAYKQLINILLCLPIILFISFINIRILYHYSWVVYLLVLICLIYVEISGYRAMGAQRWVNIGPLRFQPSEPAKIAIILMLARYFHNLSHINISKISHLILPISMVLLPAALVIKQPDLGTGIIILIVAASIFFAAGVSIWKFVFIGSVGIISMPILWQFLKEYQKKRILVFLNLNPIWLVAYSQREIVCLSLC